MKFSLLAAAALCGSTVNAEVYFKEQFNDDVSSFQKTRYLLNNAMNLDLQRIAIAMRRLIGPLAIQLHFHSICGSLC